MANNQQIAGSANIISGVPERVGMPIEAFKEVGAILTQRYYQNKQAHDSITTSLKNMQTIRDDVDKPMLAEKSKVVDESFKRIVETDNYHNATSTVMDVSKFLSTDEGIKGLQKNISLISKWEEDFDKQAKEKGYENWNLFKDDYKKTMLKNYKGSVDENGKYKQINIFKPTTNLNFEDEIKRAEEIASTVEKEISIQFGNVKNISPAMLSMIKDDRTRAVLSMLPESEDKSVREIRSINDIRKAVTNYLSTDVDFKQKAMEITYSEHLKNTNGRVEVLPEDVLNMLKNNPSLNSEVIASISPMFITYKEDLDNKYEDSLKSSNPTIRNKAISNYNKELNNLLSKEEILKDGINQIQNNPKIDLQTLYYNTLIGDKIDKVVQSGDRFAFDRETDRSRHYFTTNFAQELLKENEAEKSKVITPTTESMQLSLENSILNDKSDLGQQYIVTKNEYDRMVQIRKNPSTKNQIDNETFKAVELKYNYLKGLKESTSDNIYDNYIGLITSGKTTKNELDKNILQGVRSYINSEETALRDTRSSYLPANTRIEKLKILDILKQVTPEDLLKRDTKQILSKYSKDAKVSATFYNMFNSAIKQSKSYSQKQVVDTSNDKGLISVEVQQLNHLGTPSILQQGLTKQIVNDLIKGNLYDVKAGVRILEGESETIDGNKHMIKGESSLWDIENAEIIPLQGNGAFSKGNAYKVVIPILGKYKDGQPNKNITADRKEFTVYYDNAPEESKELLIEYANTAAKQLRNPITYATSYKAGVNAVKAISANSSLSFNPDPKVPSESSWEVINKLKSKPGKYSTNIYQHNDPNDPSKTTRINIVKDDNGNITTRFYDYNGNSTSTISENYYTKPTRGLDNKNGYDPSFEENLLLLFGTLQAPGLDRELSSEIINNTLKTK